MRAKSGLLFPLVSFRTNCIYNAIYKQHLLVKAEPYYYCIYDLVAQLAVIFYNTAVLQ